MNYYVLKSSVIILSKIKPTVILSSSFHTSIKLSSNFNFQRILKTKFIKRDFYINANNYNNIKYKSKEEQDRMDDEKLQQLLKDSNNAKLYKLLKYEFEYMQQLDEPLPKNMRPKDWIYLIKAPSKSQQRKYLRFLFINEVKEKNAKEKKLIEKDESFKELQQKQESFPSGLTYGLGKTSLFMRFYDKSMDNFFNYNAILSMLYEPKIVFDCGYENNMTPFEMSNCARQLLMSFVLNRNHKTPAHLYLCNAFKDNQLLSYLHRLIPSLYEDTFPLDITPRSYLDIFDKNKLVYLTPHCRTQMTSYNPDKIYVIGALVDKADPKPYSLAKAKKEGICMEQLPLDKYLQWGSGSGKSLTLNQVIGILLDLKYTKNWLTALNRNIPTRKLARNQEKADRSRMLN